MKKLLLILLCLPMIGFGQQDKCVSGNCENGNGTYIWISKSEFGEWRNDVLMYEETTFKYVGEFKGSRRNGLGTYTFTTVFDNVIKRETKYIGEWVDGDLIKGTYICDLYKYEGEFSGFKQHGLGARTYYSDGSKAEGLFLEGVFCGGCSKYYGSNCNNGEGTFIYPNGSRYIGNWKGGKRHGQGTIVAYSGLKDNKWTFNDESKYTGEWKDGKRYSLEHRIKAFVEQKVNEWQQKGEFEKTTVYLERVNEINRTVKIKELQKAAIEALKLDFLNSINFSNIELGEYDADNETFLLKDSKLGDLVISVPISKAKLFKTNFYSFNFVNPECVIIDEKFVLSYVEIKTYQYNYTYNLANVQDYTITDIEHEFSPIEIDDITFVKKTKSSNINERNSSNFKVFVNAFIDDCLSLSNFHESYSNSSRIISKYISSKFGAGHYFNPGAVCYFNQGPSSITYPDGEYIMDYLSPETTIYDDDLIGGFCEPAEQPNGLYYNVISRLPSFPDSYDDAEYIYHPYEEYNKIRLTRLNEGSIQFSIYFIQDKDGKWYLTYLDYCDCSA